MKKKIYFSSLIMAFVICISQLSAQILPCPTPTGLMSSNITAVSATISWIGQANSGNYNFHYRVVGTNAWLSGSTATLSANLTGLSPSTMYEWQVRLGCPNSAGSVTFSPWSPSAYFTTISTTGCTVPGGLFVNNLTISSAKLNWNATSAVNYKIRYRQTGSLAWTIKYSNINNKTITGLNQSTSYQWQVKGKCISPNGAITWSNWSNTVTFQTPGTTVCPTPTGLTATGAAANNNIILTWNSTGAMSYNIRYRTLNTATWITTSSNTNSKTLSNLAGNTGFEWQVQSVCAVNGAVVLSAWSASAFFTTNSPLSPNPSNERIYFNHFSRSNHGVQLTVRDQIGTVYITEKRHASEGNNRYEINVNTLKNGLYYLELSGSEGTVVSKFYVQH